MSFVIKDDDVLNKYTMKFRTRSKRHEALNFTVCPFMMKNT